MKEQQEIPVIWKRPHHSHNLYHVGTLSLLLDAFIKRYRKRLDIRNIMIDFEMPHNAADVSNKTFIIKLHVTLETGKIIIAESTEKSIHDAMSKITIEFDNQTRSTDRQKHPDNSGTFE